MSDKQSSGKHTPLQRIAAAFGAGILHTITVSVVASIPAENKGIMFVIGILLIYLVHRSPRIPLELKAIGSTIGDSILYAVIGTAVSSQPNHQLIMLIVGFVLRVLSRL